MLRLDPVFGSSGANESPSRFSPGLGGDGRGFSTLYRELDGEIRDFIENGSGASVTNGMTPEAYAQRALAQEATQGAGGEGDVSDEFVNAVLPLARETGAALGVAPEIITAQAALESGWGRRPVRGADGTDSHNLFGIKAGSGWKGDTAQAVTTEYEQGGAVAKTERFRAYPNDASSFKDFTKLLLNNPRYQGALNAGSDVRAYAQGLVRGGYATDPAYAEKLARVASRIHSKD